MRFATSAVPLGATTRPRPLDAPRKTVSTMSIISCFSEMAQLLPRRPRGSGEEWVSTHAASAAGSRRGPTSCCCFLSTGRS